MCVFPAKERKKKLESLLDDVIMIIANDQFLCFCNKRKDMLLTRILIVIKRCLIKQWTRKGYGTNINKVFNTDSNNVTSYSKNGELVILSIF